MEKIQIITNEPEKVSNYPKEITINNFNKLKALDEHEINVFDLNCKDMWWNQSTEQRTIMLETKMSADFRSVKQMIANSSKSINIICLPQNLEYCWQYYM